jgi:hypothetical protein
MKMPSWLSRLRQGSQLALIAAIFFLSFLTFNILFKATAADNYFQEIIAALIGTILAAVITTMLLRSQTKGEELKDRNVEVFRKKVEAYEGFLDQVLEHLQDWQLTDKEVQQLRRSVYRLSLFSSEDTVITVTNFVRGQYLQDKDCNLSEVISAFRRELALENVDELATWDMDAVDFLLRADSADAVGVTHTRLAAFRDALREKVIAIDPRIAREMKTDELEGVGDGLSFDIKMASGVSFGISSAYTDT